MSYSKHAFTMIELVFVIVILGILAAVAIPKLAATRIDAEVSKKAQNIMTGVAEIASYAMARSQTDTNLSVMSNGIKSLSLSGEAVLSANKAVIKMGTENNCVTVEIVTGVNDDNVTVSTNALATDADCKALQTIINDKVYPITVRGTHVTY